MDIISKSQAKRFLETFLKSFSQIFLQENVLSGVLILTGLIIANPTAGLFSVIAVIVSILTSEYLKIDKNHLRSGLYGFNPALVGVALAVFYPQDLIGFILVISGAVLSIMIQYRFLKRNTGVFTLSFVFTTWLIMALVYWIPITKMLPPSASFYNEPGIGFILKSFGQVIFQEKMIAGLFFALGILINSPKALLFALIGILGSYIISSWLNVPLADINMGLYGYNAILSALVFTKIKEDSPWLILSVAFTVLLSFVMFQMSFPPLTFPFVLISILVLKVKNLSGKKE